MTYLNYRWVQYHPPSRFPSQWGVGPWRHRGAPGWMGTCISGGVRSTRVGGASSQRFLSGKRRRRRRYAMTSRIRHRTAAVMTRKTLSEKLRSHNRSVVCLAAHATLTFIRSEIKLIIALIVVSYCSWNSEESLKYVNLFTAPFRSSIIWKLNLL